MRNADGRSYEYRDAFVKAAGPPPWECYFGCGRPVTEIGREIGKGNVHHLDGDHMNDELSNLTVAHHECHARAHMAGKPKTREHVEKVTAKVRGIKRTSEQRQRLSDSHKIVSTCERCGRIARKESLARHDCRLTVTCPNCGFKASGSMIWKHRKVGCG